MFSLFCFSLSHWKSVVVHVHNLGFTLSKWCIVSSLVDIDTVTFEKKYPNYRRSILIVEILPIRIKTLSNQSTHFCKCICHYLLVFSNFKPRGPWATLLSWETMQINEHIFSKLWAYHNVYNSVKKKSLSL